MNTTDLEVPCPTCGTGTTTRFCGRCGALIRSREVAPDPGAAPPVPLLGPEVSPEPGAPPPPSDGPRVLRRRAVAVAAGLLVATLVAGLVLRPTPEVVTADGLAGPDGSGRTSTRAVTDLSPRWDAAWNGPPTRPTGVRALHDLGDLLVLATDSELIGLAHPTALSTERGPDLPPRVDPVLWRSPPVAGTPRPVDGRLAVLAGAELLWLSTSTGDIVGRHDVEGPDDPVSWSPAFATPAGDVLVTPDGTTVLGQGGDVRWREGAPGELVGVAGDVVATLADRTVTGRDLGTGAERWSVELERTGHVSARLVDGVLVTVELGGRVTTREPSTGRELDAVRVGPVPATGPSWDGEATIVGTTETDVFVRVDAPVGIRYARVRAATADVVEDLVGLANDDIRGISEHAGYLVTVKWDTVAVRRGGEVAWTAVQLEQPPVGDGDWLALSDGPFGVVGVDGSPTRIRVDAGGQEVPVGRPAVLDGRAVVGTAVGVQALDLTTGEPAWSRPLGTWGCCPALLAGRDAVVLTGPVRVLDADGERRWDDPVVEPDASTRVAAIAPPWVVVTRRSERLPGSTHLLRLTDGRPGPALLAEEIDDVVVAGPRLFGLEAVPAGGRDVVAFALPSEDATDGAVRPLWRRAAGGTVQLVHADGELLVVGPAAVEHVDPGTGELVRRSLLPALGTGPVAVADGHLVRRVDGSTLEVIHLASGETWTRTFPQPLTAAPTVAGDVVYVAAGPVVHALSLDTAAAVASVEVDAPEVTSLTVAGGVVLAGGPDRLHAFGRSVPPGAPGGSAGR